jgi:predicted RNA binding protein YcfA (HicA-like mRNA interferase family)
LKIDDVIRRLEADGRYLIARRGCHRQYKHRAKPGRVAVAGKPSDDVTPGTLNSIPKQAGLKLRTEND